MRQPNLIKLNFYSQWLKRASWALCCFAAVYLAAALVIFDFTSIAVPYDEENHGGKQVAIGPRPYWWVPNASFDYDLPGGFSYDASGWPFRFWKPLCLVFLKSSGYELPAEWRVEN